MKRNRIIGIIAAAALVIVFVIGVNLWKSRSVFRVEQDGKGTILVTARNTAEGAAGESSLSLGERRSLVVRSSLKGDGTLRLDAAPAGGEAAGVHAVFTGKDVKQFPLEQGYYDVRVTAREGATGTLTIHVQ